MNLDVKMLVSRASYQVHSPYREGIVPPLLDVNVNIYFPHTSIVSQIAPNNFEQKWENKYEKALNKLI